MRSLGLFLILSSTSAVADGYVDLAAGAAYGRYRSTLVHEESDAGGVVATFTKRKSGSAVGAAIALHAGYRTHGLELGGVIRFGRYSMELPDINVIDDSNGRRTEVEPPYTTSIKTTTIGLTIGYEYRGWFARGELGVGKHELGDQPCLCLGRTDFSDEVTAGAEVGYRRYVSHDWVLAPVASVNGAWAKVSDQIDFLDSFDTHTRMVQLAVMASLVYQPR